MFTKLKNSKEESQRGFTIIEVMIVLAIAGLILLIVFLAIPALQRNSRNTQRKNDVSALLSGYSTYLDNNNGTPPASCDYNAAGCWMKDSKLGFYDGTTTGNVTWTKQAAATAPANVADTEHVALYNNAKCAATASTTTQGTSTTTTTGASSRTAVAMYAVEGGNNTTYICQDL